tara:strand:- start:1524 stop:1985 length:462 start_codon:yes stop_codon:yes gene_type:complete
MTRRKWTITTYVNGQQREVSLVVYDTLGVMRRESTKWANRVTQGKADFSAAEGVCHGFELIRVYKDGSEKKHPHAVTVRLAQGHTSPLIVSHEIAHAAQHLYALDFLGSRRDELAVDHIDVDNENFAHLYGELFAAAWGAINSEPERGGTNER